MLGSLEGELHQCSHSYCFLCSLPALFSSNFPFEKMLLTHPLEGVCLIRARPLPAGR